MRRARLLTLLLAAALPVAAGAQGTRETARQAEQPATGTAAELQAYALTLQDAETRLAAARAQQERGPSESQAGAASAQRIDLTQASQAAWQSLQRVPSAYSETLAYQQAHRRVQHDLSAIGPSRDLDKAEALRAADDMLQALAELRRDVASAATQAGGAIPAPPVQGGGTPR
jgi:hypothetical protein